MGAHLEYQGGILSKTIPPELHQLGYEGIAAAVTYQCLLDVITGTQYRLNREVGVTPRFSPNFTTAMNFLKRKNNPLYLLEIPGEELAEKFIRRTEDDWNRKRKQGKLPG